MTGMSSRRAVALTISAAVVLFLVVRLYVLDHSWMHGEEQIEFGLFADHLVHGGVSLDRLRDYQPQPREGGTLFFGAFCAPVFATAGSTYYSLRLCSVLWHTGTLVVLALLAALLAGPLGAALISALWILAPPLLIFLGHYGCPNHLEVTPLTGLAILLLAHGVGRGAARRLRLCTAACGLLCGLAITFHLSALPMVLAVALATEVAHRRAWGPSRWVYLAGLAVGLLPLLFNESYWSNLSGYWNSTGGNPLLFLIQEETSSYITSTKSVWARLLGFFRFNLFDMWDFQGQRSLLQGAAYLAAILTLCLLGLSSPRGAPEEDAHTEGRVRQRSLVLLAAGAAVLLYTLATLLSGFELDMAEKRYLAPLMPYLLLLAASAAAIPGLRRGRLLRPVITLVAALTALFLCGHALAITYFNAGTDARIDRWLRGYTWCDHPMGRSLARAPRQERLALVASRPRDRTQLLRIHGWAAGAGLLKDGLPDLQGARLIQASAGLPAVAAPYFWEGVGERLARWALLDAGDKQQRRQRGTQIAGWVASQTPWPGLPYLAFGLGKQFHDDGSVEFLLQAWAPFIGSLPQGLRQQACAGLGSWSFSRRDFNTARNLVEVKWCAPSAYAAGLGLQLAREILPVGAAPDPAPRLRWWSDDIASPSTARAFGCALRAESRRVAILAASGWREAPAPAGPLTAPCSP